MSDLRKAAEQVLEVHDKGYGKIAHDVALENLREALKEEWNELTKQDVLDALGVLDAEEAVFRIAKAIEMKSKEKNGG